MFDDDHEGPELHVPEEALRKPKGAAVADDGTVKCISCGERFPVSAVDIVGQGYRCAPCGHQAHVASLERGVNVDAGAHLSKGTRQELMKTGKTMVLFGVVVMVLGAGLFVALLKEDIGQKLGGIIVAAGAGLAITGSMKKEAAGG